MSFIMVDIEADGPAPGLYSMIELGAVIVKPGLGCRFHGKLKPISENFNVEALKISNNTREKTLTYNDPKIVMQTFADWIEKNSKGRPILISDNPGFDSQFINYYFHRFLGRNPFGWSSRRLGDIYCGMQKNAYAQWKQLRDTPHTHDPVDDCIGNCEVLLKMQAMGLKIELE